jgi:hypothetical protein
MAEQILQGRRGAKIEGDFVVFLIGARLDVRNPIRSLRDLGGRRGMPAMRRDCWKRVGKDPRSGIWHETFLVRAGEYEAVYGNMPPHGLARASEVVPIGADSSARGRLRRRSS